LKTPEVGHPDNCEAFLYRGAEAKSTAGRAGYVREGECHPGQMPLTAAQALDRTDPSC
jgi:hypothetical protein